MPLKSRRSLVFPVLVTVLIALIVYWLESTANVARGFASPSLVLFGLLMLALWLAASPRKGRGLRVISALAVAAVLGGLGVMLLKYDGSMDGTARPRLVWRWQHTGTAAGLAVVAGPSADPAGADTAPPGARDWLRFAGPAGDGNAGDRDWDTDWSANPPRLVWRIEIGEGWSGFVVHKGRAFTQEQRAERECVTCYDLASGSLLWLHSDDIRFEEPLGGPGPRATPALDPSRGRLYSLGATGLLNCLELATGSQIWQRDTHADSGGSTPTWARSGSPLVHGESVIVGGGSGGATLVAYDASNGGVKWTAKGDSSSYSSPVVLTLGGRQQIVSVNQTSVTGHAPEDGALLWSFPWPGTYPKVGQPVLATPDRILVTAGYGMKSQLIEVKAGAEAADWSATSVWSGSAPRTKFGSASVLGDHLYAIDEGTLVCCQLSDGRRLWREGRYGYGQQLLCGDTLLLQTEPGPVVIVRPDPAGLKELGRLPALEGKTWNSPALAGRWLLVRNDRQAACYELPALAGGAQD
jgi:outer membrane protein assembly factor BamB